MSHCRIQWGKNANVKRSLNINCKMEIKEALESDLAENPFLRADSKYSYALYEKVFTRTAECAIAAELVQRAFFFS